MKVLIVDDDEGLAAALKQMIESEVYKVNTARGGEEGYLAYLLFRPDVVITDIQMPEKNGFELVKDIRTHDPAIRTIYMSGNLGLFWSLIEEEKRTYRAGFLEKPFSRSQLIELIAESAA
jgi:YesN/AraC family two-component response regulator